ncbi:hypothetical protein L861_05385 [Litchfieldella anticariensis FP35 = DSM 16096]|uniref:DUF306 domain-containing protein n=1 Tax=Litchfieldella anticariensis (strain DSM 16096 / CECT 5854 / CIP 108499 / LMG 22089 / FP35) TaxID=1121939 RepID=S2L1F1_LITA3|nr:hypothetical protein [Halomonas anticariensis]EPC01474.1 hypothetical protein L861_05385 [Halomonas anticariensis FP35 = DSM 16096]
MSNDSADLLYGRWAAEPAWCESDGEGTPITLSKGRFEGRENVCEMETSPVGESEWTAELQCSGEGMASSERLRMHVEDDAMTLTYLDRDGAVVSLTRCP